MKNVLYEITACRNLDEDTPVSKKFVLVPYGPRMAEKAIKIAQEERDALPGNLPHVAIECKCIAADVVISKEIEL